LTLHCIQVATAGIAVPQVRQVADYSANVAALKPGGGTRKYNEINPVTTAYIRSQEDVFAPQTMDQVGGWPVALGNPTISSTSSHLL
jgi:hypothetical protein